MDRCDLSCSGRMSKPMRLLPGDQWLTVGESDRSCSAFIARGVCHLRLTGGEPLVRNGFLDLVRTFGRHL